MEPRIQSVPYSSLPYYKNAYQEAETRSNDILRRLQRLLQDAGISKSFREVKQYDTIELIGTSDNGRERILINEIRQKYGENIIKEKEAINIMMPFIPEGVLKVRSGETIIYTYFAVYDNGKDSDVFDLDLEEYHFNNGVFHLKYTAKVSDVKKIETPEDNRGFTIECACMKDFLDNIPEGTLEKEFASKNALHIRSVAEYEVKIQEREIITIINYLLSTFRSINFLKSLKAETQKQSDIKGGKSKGSTAREIREKTTKVKQISLDGYFSYKPSRGPNEPSGTDERSFTRRTEKWLVSGHLRHLKSGRTVYIQPYYKGPGREGKEKDKTVYQITQQKNEKDDTK